jgi:carboxyl-terminal processing protease
MFRCFNKHFLCIIFFSISYQAQSQSSLSFCQQAKLLVDIFEKYHYQPIAANDGELAHRSYGLFLQAIDPHSLYFLASDTLTISLSRKIVNEGFNDRSCEVFNQITALYRKRLIEVDTLISSILQKPFDFEVHDTISFGESDSMYFAGNALKLKARWNKWLKYEALQYLFFPDSISSSSGGKTLSEREIEIRAKVKVREKRIIRRILDHPDGFVNYVNTTFFNAIASSFDPHTSYFSPVEKDNFESTLSMDAYSYGFDIDDTQNGTVRITRLVPGGPAWKSGELHKGDVLLQVKWPEGPAVDLSCSDQEEVSEILSSSGSDRMELTVEKMSGQQKTVKLIKAKLEVEDNLIRSFILRGVKTIGYISLPGFYTEWENQNVAGCASDMVREIVKLKNEHVDGIVLDLRNNGGGAMNEALSLAGIFLESGPLCISRDRGEDPVTLKDSYPGAVYDGPLVVMVNGNSASASEILTASLQDYHRALIVGTPTFGKATGQIIFPVDTTAGPTIIGSDSVYNSGYVKVTVTKFYRLNGVSYQKEGVIPDILFPVSNEDYTYHENTLRYPLPSDTISRKPHFKPLVSLPIKKLSEMSWVRLQKDHMFERIADANDSLMIAWKEMKRIVLSPDELKKKEESIYKLMQRVENLVLKPSVIYKVDNLKFDLPLIHTNDYKNEMNQISLKNIQEDVFIDETYKIMCDLIRNVKR